MDHLDGMILLKNEYGFGIIHLYEDNVLIVESEEAKKETVNELINRGYLILYSSQRNEIKAGRQIPKLIDKTNEYYLYQWIDTNEYFTVRIDDFIEKPKKYNMYFILNTEVDVKYQILTFRREFPIFLSDKNTSEFLRELKINKEILFSEDVDFIDAKDIIKIGMEYNLIIQMRECN